MYYKLLVFFITSFFLFSCAGESNEPNTDTVKKIEEVRSGENGSKGLSLAIIDDVENFSQTYELGIYIDEDEIKYATHLMEKFRIDLLLEQEMEQYNFRTLALIPPGKVYDLATKKSVSEGCFPMLFDSLSGLVFSHTSLEKQYEHFKSTDLTIETPLSGTWCVEGQGILTKFINNSQVSLPGQGVSYFLDSYLLSRGYFDDKELVKGLFAAGLKSLENSEGANLQLTKVPSSVIKGGSGADLAYLQALSNLNNVRNRREIIAPKGDPIYLKPVADLESVEVVLGSLHENYRFRIYIKK